MIRACIIWYIGGMSFFYSMTILKKDLSSWCYYGWEKILGMLFWVCLYKNFPSCRKILMPVIVFNFGRILLEIAIAVYGVSEKNDWWIAILFLTALIATACITLYKGSSRDKFLSEYTPFVNNHHE